MVVRKAALSLKEVRRVLAASELHTALAEAVLLQTAGSHMAG
jgi:hypothetical protein